jgi:hypothetical protein
MSKYAPLTNHLSAQSQNFVPMRFSELEKLLGFGLPESARKHRAWWSNNPSNSVMTKAWLAAGYQSEQVDLESEKLTFKKVQDVALPVAGEKQNLRHPLFGCMAGTVRIAPNVDLTAPTAPEWEDQLLEKFDRLLGPRG